jgi:hypothetical protein
MMEIGNDCFDEFLRLLEIPETREALLEFKEKIKIIFKDKIERFEKMKDKNEMENKWEYNENVDNDPDKIIHLNKNWKNEGGMLSEYEYQIEDREIREFIHYLLTFPFFRQMVLQEFYFKTKPFFKNKFDEYLKKEG